MEIFPPYTIIIRGPSIGSGIGGSIIVENQTFRVENGTALLLFNESGTKECVYTATGRDVTLFTITIHGHSIRVVAPESVVPGEEVTVRFLDERGQPIVQGRISYLLTRNGTVVTSGTLAPGTSSLIVNPTMPGIWTVVILAPDHVAGEVSFTVSDDVPSPVPPPRDPSFGAYDHVFIICLLLILLLVRFVVPGTPGRGS